MSYLAKYKLRAKKQWEFRWLIVMLVCLCILWPISLYLRAGGVAHQYLGAINAALIVVIFVIDTVIIALALKIWLLPSAKIEV
jgi:hypothetical protein